MSDTKGNPRFIFQFMMLLLLLVIFPIGTYFWMVGGNDYRKNRIAQLADLGTLQDFKVLELGGKEITGEDVKKRMVIAAFLSEDNASAKKLLTRIELLQNQLEGLKRRKDILYLIHIATDSLPLLKDRVNALGIKPDMQHKLVTASKDYLKNLAIENYKMNGISIFDTNVLTLVDLNGTVRTHYDAMNNDEMGDLVEHMAIILPKEDKKDIIFKRDTEK